MANNPFIGKTYAPFTVTVTKDRIRQFAEAIGDGDPIYRDETTARAAGYAAIPAPPTFAFTITMDANQPFMALDDMGIDKTRTVHGEQSFAYHRPVLAGDTIRGQQKIADIFDKKGGALKFIVTEISLTNQRGEKVCDLRTVSVARQG